MQSGGMSLIDQGESDVGPSADELNPTSAIVRGSVGVSIGTELAVAAAVGSTANNLSHRIHLMVDTIWRRCIMPYDLS